MEFKMPDIGEGVMEGEIVKWLVKEGDTVAEDQPLVEVMTDKATVVIPCPTGGRVQRIFVPEGQTARVGAVLVSFGSEAPAAPAPAPPAPEARREAPAPPRPEPARPEPARVGASRPLAADNGRHATAPAPQARTGRPLAAPATRRLAREAGLDLAEVRGTGPSGRITREDLLAHLDGRAHQPSLREAPIAAQVPQQEAAPAAPRPAATPPPPRPSFPAGPRPEQRIPLRGLRKRIAEKMRTSVDTAAHFTYVEECDMTELVKLRDSAEDLAKARGVKLSYLPFIIKAIIAGLKEYPYLNATLDDATQEIVLKGYYNIGIGAATDEGLTVFVVKDCDRKSMLDIAADIQYLGEAARTGTLKIDDLQGGTFTITSLGALGGILATPVINHPEVAILGVHKIRKRPVVRDDQIVVRDICYLSISLDHRVIDGHVGAQFMQRVVQLLEDPWLLMLGA